jgi:hypothetical protein
MAMGVGNVTVKVNTDTRSLIQFARVIEKHFGALADDLEKLRDDGADSRSETTEA